MCDPSYAAAGQGVYLFCSRAVLNAAAADRALSFFHFCFVLRVSFVFVGSLVSLSEIKLRLTLLSCTRAGFFQKQFNAASLPPTELIAYVRRALRAYVLQRMLQLASGRGYFYRERDENGETEENKDSVNGEKEEQNQRDENEQDGDDNCAPVFFLLPTIAIC